MKSIIGFVGTLILAYLVGAFISADFNLSVWALPDRVFVALVGIWLAVLVAVTLDDR